MSDQPPVNVNVNQPPEPSVRIGMGQVYAEVLRQGETNARIEGKVDLVVVKVDGLAGQVTDHESRLRLLEANSLTKRAIAGIFVGGATVLGGLVSLAALIWRQ